MTLSDTACPCRCGNSIRAVLLLFVGIALLAATSVAARPCHDKGVDALARAVRGQAIDAKGLRSCRSPLDTPPAGSGNWPIQIETALYLAGHHDGLVLLPWLSGGEAWGHNGVEFGSPIYEAWNWASALAVHHRAREKGHDELAQASKRWLRAMLAKLALAASPSPPREMRFGQGGEWFARKRLDYFGYRGPFVHLVGERAQEDPKRGKFTGSWTEVNRRHGALAWAADWPGRRHSGDFLGKDKGGRPDPGTLLLWMIARLSGVEDFAHQVEPEVFGLDGDERLALRGFLEEPTDADRAKVLLPWLDGYPRPEGAEVVIRRYRGGQILTVLRQTRNANKSGAVVVGFDGRISSWIAPSRFRGVKAASARGWIEDGRAVARSNDGHTMELRIGDWGELAWQIVWGAPGVALTIATSEAAETEADSEEHGAEEGEQSESQGQESGDGAVVGGGGFRGTE